MRVLITGVDGFVGSHAAEFLLRQAGVEVHGTILGESPTRNLDGIVGRPSLHLHRLDILDAARTAKLFAQIKPERVLHLAGQAFVPVSLSDPLATFQVNIVGGMNVLEGCRKLTGDGGPGPHVMVVSTGEVYGKVDPNLQPIRETCPISPNNPYAASKASIDLIAQQFAMSFGLTVTVVRPFNHVGPRQSPVFVCSDFGKQFAEIAAGNRPCELRVGNLETRRDFTDVRDVVRAYWMLFDRKESDVVYNICSGQTLQIRDILEAFQTLSGISVKIISEPQRLRPYDVSTVVGSNERLRGATGWFPSIPIRQTLMDVFEYWKDEVEKI